MEPKEEEYEMKKVEERVKIVGSRIANLQRGLIAGKKVKPVGNRVRGNPPADARPLTAKYMKKYGRGVWADQVMAKTDELGKAGYKIGYYRDHHIIEALWCARGFVSIAARILDVSADALAARIQRSERLQKVRERIDESVLDMSEYMLTELILDKNLGAIKTALFAKGKKRGYALKSELDLRFPDEGQAVADPEEQKALKEIAAQIGQRRLALTRGKKEGVNE